MQTRAAVLRETNDDQLDLGSFVSAGYPLDEVNDGCRDRREGRSISGVGTFG